MTAFRFGLNYVAVILFPSSPEAAGLVLMISVIFDYFDGMAARKYKQCSFFGDIFDWITDVLTLAIVLFIGIIGVLIVFITKFLYEISCFV